MDNTHSIEQRQQSENELLWSIDPTRANDVILVVFLLTLGRFHTWIWFFH